MKKASVGLLSLAWIASAVLGLAACDSDEARRDAAVAAAEQLLAQGEEKRALIELRNALKLDPKNARINFLIAEAFERSRQYSDAVFFYGEAHRLDPELSEAVLAEAALLLFDDTERSSELVERAGEIDPANPFLFVMRSRLSLLAGDAEEALRHAFAARELAPGDARVQLQLGKVHQARIRARQLQDEDVPDSLFRSALEALELAEQLGDDSVAWAAAGDRVRVLAAWGGHEEEAAEALRERVRRAQARGDEPALRSVLRDAEHFARRSGNRELTLWVLQRHTDAFPENVEAWWRLSLETIRDGSDGEAVLKRMLERIPNSGQAHVRYAQFIARSRDTEAATAHLEAVLDSSDNPPLVGRALAILLRQQGRGSEAEALLARLAVEHPDHPGTLLARADQLTADGDLAGAVGVLRQLSGKVRRPDVETRLAELELQLNDLAAALAASQRAITYSRGRQFPSAAIRVRARAEARLGDCSAALRSLGALSGNDVPLRPPERGIQARCLHATGRTELARKVLEGLEKRHGPTPWWAVEVAAIESRKHPERAREALERALTTSPGDPTLLVYLAALDAASGQPRRGLDRLSDVRGEAASSPAVRLQRARLLAATGAVEQAREEALAAFEAEPGLAGAAAAVVQLYSQAGQLDTAIASFEQARQAGTLTPSSRLLLSNLYMRAERKREARELLEQIVADASAPAAAKNDLAYLLATADEELDRALDLARQARRDLPGSAPVADTLGLVYLRRNLHQPALNEFRSALQLAAPGDESLALYHLHAGLALEQLGREEQAVRELEQAIGLDADLAGAREALSRLQRAADATTARDDAGQAS